jgi:hypothetical protein
MACPASVGHRLLRPDCNRDHLFVLYPIAIGSAIESQFNSNAELVALYILRRNDLFHFLLKVN